jgi:hypothetical protein
VKLFRPTLLLASRQERKMNRKAKMPSAERPVMRGLIIHCRGGAHVRLGLASFHLAVQRSLGVSKAVIHIIMIIRVSRKRHGELASKRALVVQLVSCSLAE